MVGAPATESPLIEAATQESPTPEPVEAPSPPIEVEGEQAEVAGKGEILKELFKGATASDLRAALDEAAPEVRQELEAEIERRGEQRALTREKEVTDATSDRTKAYQASAEQGKKAEAYLIGRLRAANQGDPDAFADARSLGMAIEDYKALGVAEIAEANEAALDPILRDYLPEMTADERKILDKPLYNFGVSGDFSKVLPKIAEVLAERAYQRGLAEGQSKAKASDDAKLTLAERAEKLLEVRNGSPGLPKGRPNPTVASLREQIAQKDALFKKDLNAGRLRLGTEEFQQRDTELRDLQARLPKE